MLVKVTQEHIDKGVRSHRRECPIALAINQLLNNKVFCFVNCKDISFYKKGFTGICDMPKIGYAFINDYDSGVEVEPFEMEINIPKEVLK